MSKSKTFNNFPKRQLNFQTACFFHPKNMWRGWIIGRAIKLIIKLTINQFFHNRVHSRIYQSYSHLPQTEMQFKHTVTVDKHVNNLTGLYKTLPTSLDSHIQNTLRYLTHTYILECIQKTTHTYTNWNLRNQKSVPTYIIWKLTGGADNKQLSPEHSRGWRKSKLEKTNMGDVIKAKWQVLCEKDWRVSSYLLLPGFQY